MGLFGKKQTDDERKLANRTPETARAIAGYIDQRRQGNSDATITFKMIMMMTEAERAEIDRLGAESGSSDVKKMG